MSKQDLETLSEWGERQCPVCEGLEFSRHDDRSDEGECPLYTRIKVLNVMRLDGRI